MTARNSSSEEMPESAAPIKYKAHGTSISLGFDFCAAYLDPLLEERRRQTGNAKVSRSDIARELIVFGHKYRNSLYLISGGGE